MLRLCIYTLLTITVLLSASLDLLAKDDRWINIQTKNFNLVSNAEEKKARELVLKIEQFRYTFKQIYPNVPENEPVPVTIMLFKDEKSFNDFLPRYEGKKRKNVPGYFLSGEDENVIALTLTDDALRVIFHEYTHLITSYSTIALPPWLDEGLAEVYSTFEIDKNEVVIGSPLTSHVQYLRENDLKLIPLQQLINADHKSPLYNKNDQASSFYTQSWALVHYFLLAERGKHKTKLFKFIKLLRQGKTNTEAFPAAFETDFTGMENEVRAYISNSNYPIVKYKFDTRLTDKDISIKPLSDCEALAYQGNLLLRRGLLDEADNYLKRAYALDKTQLKTLECLGLLAVKKQQYKEAQDYLKQAIERGSQSYLAYYHLADSIYAANNSAADAAITNKELAKQIQDNLQQAVKLKPEFAPAYHLSGLTQLASKDDYKAGLAMVNMAVLLAPQQKRYLLTLATLHIRLSEFDYAKKILAKIGNDDDELKQAAQDLLKQIEDLKK